MKGFEDLWAAVRGAPHSLALVVGEGAGSFVGSAASWKGTTPASVGMLLTVEDATGWEHPERLLRSYPILVDLDALFCPSVMVDPLRMLRSMGRIHPLIVLWPGQVADNRATYSEPGRRDYYDQPLDGEIVVRPRSISSTTDVPYNIEVAR